jgi:hypothetical protein
VDIPSIKQAAITNLWNHVVEDAGLKPSKKELEAVGFKFENAGATVKFNDNKPSQGASQKPAPQPAGAAARPQETSAAASSPSGPPKANIPSGAPMPASAQSPSLPIGKGIVSEVREKSTKAKNGKGGGTPFLEVVQNGHFLYCFATHDIETAEGPEKTFWLIKEAKGQFCEFTIQTKPGDRPLHSIVGALRIGRWEWEATGEPIRRPGSGYQATDEDIPY